MKSKRSNAAYASSILRRPLQRCFPLFLLPVVTAFAIGFVWPFLQGLFLSFTKFKTTSDWEWLGIGNYIKAFADESFRYSFGYTALYAIVSLVLINVIAFAVAYALTQKIKGSNLFRTVFFMPNLIGGIVLGWIWQVIINGVLYRYGATIVSDPKYGFWGLVVLMNWQNVGYMMVIYIAAIQNIPGDLLEAAAIDGAGWWTTLTKIIIPSVMPSITICLFMTMTNGFKLFDQNLALTAGEPGKQTELLALNIYNTFYGRTGFEGVGQAKAVVFTIIVATIALLQLRITRSKEVEQ